MGRARLLRGGEPSPVRGDARQTWLRGEDGLLPWDGDHAGVGTLLLGEVLNEARALGAREITHVVDAPPMPPQFQHHPEKRVKLLGSVGFAFRRETGRFEWRGEEPPAEPGRLSFRTMEKVGEEAFVEAMREVSEGTLDREIREQRERLGPQGAARRFFEDARRVKHDPRGGGSPDRPKGSLSGPAKRYPAVKKAA